MPDTHDKLSQLVKIERAISENKATLRSIQRRTAATWFFAAVGVYMFLSGESAISIILIAISAIHFWRMEKLIEDAETELRNREAQRTTLFATLISNTHHD